MTSTHEDKLAKLEQEYATLDSALVRALSLDYDVSKPEDLNALCELLNQLQADSALEDDGTFDASGTSGLADAGHGEGSNETSTTTSSVSGDMTSLSLGSQSGSDSLGPILDEYSKLDENEKLATLMDLFPNVKPGDIAFTLKKCGNDIDKAMDVLLNHAFFEEHAEHSGDDGFSARGVDAFAAGDHRHLPKRKRKPKGKNLREFVDSHGEEQSPSMSKQNKWESAHTDITFIASRVSLSESTVASVYHRNGASLSRTVIALLDMTPKPSGFDAQTNAYITDLVEEFPMLSYEQCATLVSLTRPSAVKAHELAKALSRVSDSKVVIPQYAPTRLDDDTLSTPAASKSKLVTSHDSHSLALARAQAFDSASKYHRQGKSDRLMGGAAAYYSTVGREYSSAIRSAEAAEADRIAESQSSTTHLDLHGITVKEANRIASERVHVWWQGLGESRVPGGGRRGVGEGYRIITGAGRHSVGGVGRLGPAVSKTLLREGWKLEVGTGVVTVVGKMRT